MKNLRLIICTGLIIFFAFFYFKGKISSEKFDSKLWKTADLNTENNMSLRWDMMNSLRNNFDLIGKSKKEIVDLLGKPLNDENVIYDYYLGYSHTGINTGSLKIIFDTKGRVSEIIVWQG